MLVSLVLLSLQIDSPQPLSACSRMSRILSGNHDLESLNGQMSVETERERGRLRKLCLATRSTDWHIARMCAYFIYLFIIFILYFCTRGQCQEGDS